MTTINKQDSITISKWFDRHLHVRDGEMLRYVLPCTINQNAFGAIIMGNLQEPTINIEKVNSYKERILSLVPKDSNFKPIMALYLTDDISPKEVVDGFKCGAWGAVKLYMTDVKGAGGTTGSAHGVKDLMGRYKVFEAMEKHGIPLLGHFEAPEEEIDIFDKEIVSLERDAMPLLKSFPNLKIVFEHVTDGRAGDFIAESKYNIYATVTAHHLIINRNAMFSGGMNPCYYCKPIPKRESHRLKIRKYVTSGHPRFGAGTDSAPHDEKNKSRCYGCSAGIFTAPVAVELYTMVFDEENSLHNLDSFLSKNFIEIYGIEQSKESMTIIRKPFIVPQKVGSVRVFYGGASIPWSMV